MYWIIAKRALSNEDPFHSSYLFISKARVLGSLLTQTLIALITNQRPIAVPSEEPSKFIILNSVSLRSVVYTVPFDGLDYRCADGRFLLSVRGVTILNGYSVSSSEK
jgi:hypothetical protein